MTTVATNAGIQGHEVVSSKEWIASRKELLRKEKRVHQVARRIEQRTARATLGEG